MELHRMHNSEQSTPVRKKHSPFKRRPRIRLDGEGSVFAVERELADGSVVVSWRAVKTITIHGERKIIKKQAKTAAEAVAKRDEAVKRAIINAEVEAGLRPATDTTLPEDVQRLTVKRCMYDWLEEKREDLSEASYRMYDARIRQHILPVFGDTLVRTLTYEQMKTFFKETLPAKGLGESSIKQTFIALKSALNYYLRDGVLLVHPMTGLKQPRSRVRTKDEKQDIRRASKFLNEYLLIEARKMQKEARWFVAMLGLRQGEALGLTDDCLVTRGRGANKTRRVVIKQQLQRVSAEHGCGEWDVATNKWQCGKFAHRCPQIAAEAYWHLKDTKTESGDREIVVPEVVWKMLIEHRDRQRLLRKQHGFKPAKGEGLDTLLFTNANGSPIYGQRDREELKQLISSLRNLPKGVTVHTLRHIATTRLLDGGADRESLIATMGWSPKNADAQIRTYSASDDAAKAMTAMTTYIGEFYDA